MLQAFRLQELDTACTRDEKCQFIDVGDLRTIGNLRRLTTTIKCPTQSARIAACENNGRTGCCAPIPTPIAAPDYAFSFAYRFRSAGGFGLVRNAMGLRAAHRGDAASKHCDSLLPVRSFVSVQQATHLKSSHKTPEGHAAIESDSASVACSLNPHRIASPPGRSRKR